MKLIFVHGWSVTDTKTYGVLPEIVGEQAPDDLQLQIEHVYLGQYISFKDEVRVADIVVAFDHAIKDVVTEGELFSCITHSTGGPVIREWINTYYGKALLSSLPIKHLIMLAPANHGSALAQLGKQRVGRIKSWFQGIEPGQGVLNWLELGSTDQWKLNSDWLEYPKTDSFFQFVITGQDIDKKLYDYLNSYTAEKGSDGVIRCAAANLNYRKVSLQQNLQSDIQYSTPDGSNGIAAELVITDSNLLSQSSLAYEVLPNTSHSGASKGIMASVTKRNNTKKQVVASIIECLQVDSVNSYDQLVDQMTIRTNKVQSRGHLYSMVVFKVVDDKGNNITDYDLYLLTGEDYQPDKLPKGFFIDKQMNKVNECHLTYYFDQTKLSEIKQRRGNRIGFRVVARPSEGFAFYKAGEFRSNGLEFSELLRANETLMVEITMQRCVSENTFVLSKVNDGHVDFKRRAPVGEIFDVK